MKTMQAQMDRLAKENKELKETKKANIGEKKQSEEVSRVNASEASKREEDDKINRKGGWTSKLKAA